MNIKVFCWIKIQSKNRRTGTYEFNKVSLSGLDEFIMEIDALAFGH